MADILNRLLLETKDFDAKLSNSKKGVNDYQGSITNMAKTAGTGILKFAGAFGVAIGASEAFTQTINSTQTTGDAWAKIQDQMKASVDGFFTSIAMGDFSGFLSNLQNVIDKAGDLSVALDNLGTKTLFNNSEVNDLNTKYQLEINAAKARNISDEERNKHLQIAKGYLVEMANLQGSLSAANKDASYTTLQADITKQGFNKNVSREVWEYLLKDSNRPDVEKRAATYNNKVYEFEGKISRSRQFDTALETYADTPETAQLEEALAAYKKSTKNDFNRMASVFIEMLDDGNSEIGKAIKMRGVANGLALSVSQKELEVSNTDAKINGSYNSKGSGGSKSTPTLSPATGSIASINEELAAKNKELINATTMQARIAVQTTINELEAKKINLQIATDKGIFAAEHGEDKFNVSNVRKDFSQYTDIDKQISVKRKELISTTTEEARSAVLNTINELEAKKFSIRVSLEKEVSNSTVDKQSQKNISEYMDIDSKISQQKTSLVNSTTEEARSAVQGTINELEARKINLSANIDIKSNMSSEIAGVLNNGSKDKDGKQITKGSKAFDPKSVKKIKSPISKKDVKTLDDYQEKLYNISSAMGSMAGVMGEGAASWLNWGSSLISAINQGIPAIKNLILALQGKACGEAIAGAAASGPWGWIEAGLAVASIVASFASIPAFANGGIIEGGSTFGDMNLARVNAGEMILNGNQQRNLFDLLNNGSNSSASKGGAVSFTIHGKDLKGVLSNYDNQKNKVR